MKNNSVIDVTKLFSQEGSEPPGDSDIASVAGQGTDPGRRAMIPDPFGLLDCIAEGVMHDLAQIRKSFLRLQ